MSFTSNNSDPTLNTLQKIGNLSFDTDFNVQATEILGYDAASNVLRRVLVSSSGGLLTGGYSTIADGRKVVASAGTAEALASSTTCKKVDITAETDNTGVIVVGGSTVVASQATRRGIPLFAGDTYTIEITNLSSVYLDSTVSGDGVTYTYYA